MMRTSFFILLSLCHTVYAQPDSTRLQYFTSATDTSLHYWVVMPQTPSPAGAKLPAIVFFDPRGEARIPLLRYISLADSAQVILIGASDYRNFRAADAYRRTPLLLQELPARLPIQRNMLYLAGFSGGARFAYDMAFAEKNIAGVLAVGAGYGYTTQRSNSPPFSCVNIIGNADFNYTTQQLPSF